MQLSILTGCFIDIKIFNDEDKSLLEYKSQPSENLAFDMSTVENHILLNNKDYNIINSAEIWITRTFEVGNEKVSNSYSSLDFMKNVKEELEGCNQHMFFSLAKSKKKISKTQIDS